MTVSFDTAGAPQGCGAGLITQVLHTGAAHLGIDLHRVDLSFKVSEFWLVLVLERETQRERERDRGCLRETDRDKFLLVWQCIYVPVTRCYDLCGQPNSCEQSQRLIEAYTKS